MPINKLLAETKARMSKSVEHVEEELAGVRTSKASPATWLKILLLIIMEVLLD